MSHANICRTAFVVVCDSVSYASILQSEHRSSGRCARAA